MTTLTSHLGLFTFERVREREREQNVLESELITVKKVGTLTVSIYD